MNDSIRHASILPASEEEILEYLNESERDKRIELAYKYRITKKDLYEEDYFALLDYMMNATRENYENIFNTTF